MATEDAMTARQHRRSRQREGQECHRRVTGIWRRLESTCKLGSKKSRVMRGIKPMDAWECEEVSELRSRANPKHYISYELCLGNGVR